MERISLNLAKQPISRKIIVNVTLALVTGFVTTVSLYTILDSQYREHIETDFIHIANLAAERFDNRIHANINELIALARFFQLSRHVNRQEFKQFTRENLNNHPEITSLNWLPRVSQNQLSSHIAQVRDTDLANYSVNEISPKEITPTSLSREEYFPILYSEPSSINFPLLGYDLNSQPQTSTLFDQIIESGVKTNLSTLNIGINDSDDKNFGNAIFVVAVYKANGLINDASQRQKYILGFIIANIRINTAYELANNSPYIEAEINISNESSNNIEDRLLHHSQLKQTKIVATGNIANLPELENRNHFKYQQLVDIGHQKLQLTMSPTNTYLQFIPQNFSWITLVVGLCLTLSFVYIILIKARRNVISKTLIEKRTADLQGSESYYRAICNKMFDGLITSNEKGIIESFNASAESIFGYSEKEIIGQNVSVLVPKEQAIDHDTYFERYKSTGEKQIIGTNREVRGMRKDGSTFPMDLAISEIRIGTRLLFCGVARDNSAQKSSQVSQARLWSIIESSPDLIATFDLEGNIIYMNRAGRDYLGYGYNEDLTDRSLAGILPQTEIEQLLNECATSTLMNKRWVGETNLVTIDGKVMTVSQLIMLHDDDGENNKYFSTFMRDISERQQIENELVAAKEKAETTTEVKSNFLTSMSHEIRISMNEILGMVQLMLDTKPDLQQRNYLDTIDQSGRSLLRSVSEILDFSKVEADNIELDPIPFNFEKAIFDVHQLLASRAAEKCIELIINYPPDCPKQLIGDPYRIRQIILNLINNAINFTQNGYILTEVSCILISDKAVKLHVSIQDTGIGISIENQNILFKSFSKNDASTTQKTGCTGLGLAISKQYVELMNGEIGVTSELNVGSNFWFKISLQKSAEPSLIPNAEVDNVKVLIVDSNNISKQVLEEQLKHFNMRAHSAHCGSDAITMLEQAIDDSNPYEVVIIDHRLSDMSCDVFSRKINTHNLLRDTPMVLLTSSAKKGDALYYKKCGFSGYLPKPILTETLHRLLSSVLGINRQYKETELFVTQHNIAESDQQKILQESPKFTGNVLLAEDNLVNQKVATAMLRKLGLVCTVAHNGKQALDMVFEKHYDVIFMDCQMPEMDGYTATRLIREKEHQNLCTSPIPIIALTANAMSSDRLKCSAAGMNDFVAKPVKLDELISVLKLWLNPQKNVPSETSKKLAENISQLYDEDSPAPIDSTIFNTLKNNIDENSYAELIPAYIENTMLLLTQITTAYKDSNNKILRRLAHNLKSSSASLGAMCLSSLAKELETLAIENKLPQSPHFIEAMTAEFDRVRGDLSNR